MERAEFAVAADRDDQVGDCALFLCRTWRAALRRNLHVDSGYHIVGMKAEDAPDIAVVKYDGA
jgi:enoyl-[acyl-carrier protein] reductase I